jgi:glycosyltransferase involved in cell wall biosynthesis
VQTIFINGRFLTQATTGVQRYAAELTQALDGLLCSGEISPAAYRVVLLVPRGARQDLPLKQIQVERVGWFGGHAWEQIDLRRHHTQTRGVVLFNPGNTAPIGVPNVVVTIHDAGVFAAPQAYSWTFRTWYRLMHRSLLRHASGIITVSAFSREQLEKYAAAPMSRTEVIPPGAEHIVRLDADRSVLDRYALGERPFVLAVSSLNPNKNFKLIIDALPYLPDLLEGVDFVVAGGTSPRIFRNGSAGFGPNIKYLGYVTDRELKALYQAATAFVFPSLYEGFGLPPLEAMSCGCPVVVARAASLPWVCGDAALYCDPHDPEDLAQKIRMVIGDQKLQADLRAKGLARARDFSWPQCARGTFRLLDEVLAS